MKTALITGASRGIGAAIAEAFAAKHYNLSLCCSRSGAELEKIKSNFGHLYPDIQILTFVGDVADYAFVQQMVSQTEAAFGSIDVLVNNAGISYVGLLMDMSFEEWNRIVSVNLGSVFAFCKCVVPGMVSRREGRIINISSVWGNVGASCEAAYSATKGGMNSLTKALGKELAPSNIQVNAISCGCIDTQMNACFTEEDRQALAEEIPAGRFGRPEEVAQLAIQLAEGPAYLNAQIITLDGAWV